tara:strand:- start:176 stop:580 length:405 start_codon:yes stop_codon:yes gene_type:complete
MSTKNKILIYANKNCPYCKAVKEEFNKNNIEFKNIDTVEQEDKWREVVNLTGVPTVPTIEYNNEYFVPGRDYGSADQVVGMIKTFTNSPHEQSKRVFERLKTLNYNIHQAFTRMDQLLRQVETKLNTDEHESTN